MLRLPELLALVSMATILLLLSQTAHGAPPRDDVSAYPKSQQQRLFSDMPALPYWLWKGAFNRLRRTHQIDAGFLARHNAISNFLKAYDAKQDALNPYGPGRRK